MVNYVKKFFDFIQRQNVYRASKLTFKIFFPETSFVYLSQSLLNLTKKLAKKHGCKTANILSIYLLVVKNMFQYYKKTNQSMYV